MASQSDNHIELDFAGESAEEAKDFIRAVNRHAFATGRQKDNNWMAEFAYQSFSRKALRWFETLDEETQNDWKLFKRAILAEFTSRQPAPATVPSVAPALVTSLSSPTPAAPPPSAVAVKIGRIRVDSEDSSQGGYLSISDRYGYGLVLADSSKAEIFEVDTLGRTLRFQGNGDTLAIQGFSKEPLSPQTTGYGCLMKSSAGSVTQWNHTWSITEDGNITAMLLRTDGSRCDASFLVESLDVGGAIHVPVDKEMFLECWANSYTRVTLHFEALS